MKHFLIVPAILAVLLSVKVIYDVVDGNEPGVIFTPLFGIPILFVVTMICYSMTGGQ